MLMLMKKYHWLGLFFTGLLILDLIGSKTTKYSDVFNGNGNGADVFFYDLFLISLIALPLLFILALYFGFKNK